MCIYIYMGMSQHRGAHTNAPNLFFLMKKKRLGHSHFGDIPINIYIYIYIHVYCIVISYPDLFFVQLFMSGQVELI